MRIALRIRACSCTLYISQHSCSTTSGQSYICLKFSPGQFPESQIGAGI